MTGTIVDVEGLPILADAVSVAVEGQARSRCELDFGTFVCPEAGEGTYAVTVEAAGESRAGVAGRLSRVGCPAPTPLEWHVVFPASDACSTDRLPLLATLAVGSSPQIRRLVSVELADARVPTFVTPALPTGPEPARVRLYAGAGLPEDQPVRIIARLELAPHVCFGAEGQSVYGWANFEVQPLRDPGGCGYEEHELAVHAGSDFVCDLESLSMAE